MFSNITPDKPSNFYQALRGPDQVNWIKVEFLHYDNKGDFGLFTATFTCDNLPSTTQVLLYILSPIINNISDNIYRYFPWHCANGETQVKTIDFDQTSSTFLAEPTLRLVITIAAT